jgi:hypothetical protein
VQSVGMESEERPHERFWEARARRVRRKLDLACWVAVLAPWLGGAGLAGAVALVLARLGAAGSESAVLAAAIATLGALGAAAAQMRGRRYTLADARARLDRALGLNDRLSAAAEGAVPWPAPREGAADGTAWRPRAVAAPLVLWAAPLLAALCIPLGGTAEATAREVVQPLAWLQVEAALAALEEEPGFDPEALDAMREKLDALRGTPPETWYGHGSLEAGDALREQVQRSLAELARSLDTAEQALADLERSATPGGSAESADSRLASALEALEQGAFPLDESARRTLAGSGEETAPGDASGVRRATEEDQRTMLENLRTAASSAAHEAGIPSSRWEQATLPPPGISRGPGAAPLALTESPSELVAQRDEAVRNESLDRAVPGETVGVRAVAPDSDESAAGAVGPGGAAASDGTGGEATWRLSLPPEERAILKRYFR